MIMWLPCPVVRAADVGPNGGCPRFLSCLGGVVERRNDEHRIG